MISAVTALGDSLASRINAVFEGQPPWKVALLAAGGTAALMALRDSNQRLFLRAKEALLKLRLRLQAPDDNLQEEIDKVNSVLLEEMNSNVDNNPYKLTLPPNGWAAGDILNEAQEYCNYGKYDWTAGYASGTVYNGSKELADLMMSVYAITSWSNPLHADIFPGIRKMEAEVVRMCCNMFHGGPESCGTMTNGGTESIILACKAYRDYAVKVRGIAKPEIIVPVTVHAAFDKAAQLLDIGIKHVPMDPLTMKADLKIMESLITSRTCMLVGSAPQFPHGVIDPIEEINNLGIKYNIPVHVDACLGGFLIAFMEEAGYPVPRFDFRLPGIYSISCDTHKYGFTLKGSSTILYRNKEFRHLQFFSQPNWPGGIYTTPTISGSRSGGIIAACWAAMMFYGRDGYVSTTKLILEVSKYLEKECRKVPGIKILGKPEVSIVALSSDYFNIYTLSEKMADKGWNLNALQFPSCIHFAITMPHTKPGVVDRFIHDLREVSSELMKLPRSDDQGGAAMYCMAHTLENRSVVEKITFCYLDATYATTATKLAVTDGPN